MKSIKKLILSIVVVLLLYNIAVQVPIAVFAESEFYTTYNYDVATGETTVERHNYEDYYSTGSESFLPEIDVGPFSEEVLSPYVVGDDTRVKVSDTTINPFKKVVWFHGWYKSADNKWHDVGGTGFVIGPNTIATAAHCVYIHDDENNYHGWASITEVYPARNGSVKPYGEVEATALTCGGNWANNEDETDDWAIIRLDTNIGYQTGICTIAQHDNDYNLSGMSVYTAGYPSEVRGSTNNYYMYYSSGQIRSCEARLLHGDWDSSPGDSGGPVVDSSYRAVGIVSAINTLEGLVYPISASHAVRIDEWLYNYLLQFENLEYGDDP